MKDIICGEIMDLKSTREIWSYLNDKYGAVSDDDDIEPKEEAHEDFEHDHNIVVMKDCSTSWSSDGDDDTTMRSPDKDEDVTPVF